MYEHIQLKLEGGIATVTLNRPDKLNAYTLDMGEEIVDAFDRLRDDDAARVVILTGAGRGFCAGVDLEHLKEQASKPPGVGPRLGEERLVREFPLTLLKYPKPVIAAVNGHAIGVGITMILGCDVRICSHNAKFGLTFTKMGILPGLGSTYLLPQIIGKARATELILTARIFEAPEAAEMGLVTQMVAPEQLLETANSIAAAMASANPATLAAAKALLRAGDSEAVANAMLAEQKASADLRR